MGLLPCSSDGKESSCNVGDRGLIPGWEDPLDKGMAAHSSVLAWRIPWTEEPGGLQSTESQSWTQLRDYHCIPRKCPPGMKLKGPWLDSDLGIY